MRRLSSISIWRKRITIRKKIATILLSNSFPISVLFHQRKITVSNERLSLSLSIESTIIRTFFQSGNTWDTNGYVRKGVVGWWLLTTPLVTFVPILARFEIRPDSFRILIKGWRNGNLGGGRAEREKLLVEEMGRRDIDVERRERGREEVDTGPSWHGTRLRSSHGI